MHLYKDKSRHKTAKPEEEINVQFLQDIKEKFLGVVEIITEEKEDYLSSHHDEKIMNTTIPYMIDKDGKFKYDFKFFKSKNDKVLYPPQPEGCRNRIKELGNFTKSDIRRPVPFSFSKGKSPMPGVVLSLEGIKAKGKNYTKGNLLYEPCCEMLKGTNGKGKFKDIEFQNKNPFISIEKFEEMSDNLNQKKNIEFQKEIDTFIKNTTSTKKKMIRRLVYGFPNNKFVGDSEDDNNIYMGYDEKPKLTNNKIQNDEPLHQRENILQRDIHSGVYVPGKQLENFGGDSTLIRDHRSFIGLYELFNTIYNKEEMVEKIIKCYFDKFELSKENKITIINNKDEFEDNRKSIKNDISKYQIYLKVRFFDKEEQAIKLYWNNGNEIEFLRLNKIKDKKYLFIEKKNKKNMESGSTYLFRFNYYIQEKGKKTIIKNMPLVPILPLKKLKQYF